MRSFGFKSEIAAEVAPLVLLEDQSMWATPD